MCLSQIDLYKKRRETLLEANKQLRELFREQESSIRHIRISFRDLSDVFKSNPLPTCASCLSLQHSLQEMLRLQRARMNYFPHLELEYNTTKLACPILEKCHITCKGPNHNMMNHKTFLASCKIESLLHRFIGKAIITLGLCIFLNIGRILLFLGIRSSLCNHSEGYEVRYSTLQY